MSLTLTPSGRPILPPAALSDARETMVVALQQIAGITVERDVADIARRALRDVLEIHTFDRRAAKIARDALAAVGEIA